jgi:hypothetical protein
MRSARLAVLLVLAATTVAAAADPRVERRGRAGLRTDLFIEVPLDGYSTDVIFPFGGSHHTVPGVVAVNRAPYYCAPHARAFRERAKFVTHLRTKHDLADVEIPEAVLVDGGQVRYIGD